MQRMFTNFNSELKAIQDAKNDFLNSKRGKKANDTVKYYEDRLNSFCDYLSEHEKITNLGDITRSVVDRYMQCKKSKSPTISNQTLNNNLRAIRPL